MGAGHSDQTIANRYGALVDGVGVLDDDAGAGAPAPVSELPPEVVLPEASVDPVLLDPVPVDPVPPEFDAAGAPAGVLVPALFAGAAVLLGLGAFSALPLLEDAGDALVLPLEFDVPLAPLPVDVPVELLLGAGAFVLLGAGAFGGASWLGLAGSAGVDVAGVADPPPAGELPEAGGLVGPADKPVAAGVSAGSAAGLGATTGGRGAFSSLAFFDAAAWPDLPSSSATRGRFRFSSVKKPS
jgi:hypothetical protein